MTTTTLGFTLRIARTADDVQEACAVRSRAYGHHLPEMGARFAQPDALDHADGTAILLCRDKRTGEGIGTARIQLSSGGPLTLEQSLILPNWIAGKPRAEITRLAVLAGADPLAKLCLMKASYLYSIANQLRWLVIGARNEALIRNYRRLGFRDLLDPEDRVPLAHAGNLPHSILAFDVVAAERTWQAAKHPLYAFMVDTHHPDLQLFAPSPQLAQLARPALRLTA